MRASVLVLALVGGCVAPSQAALFPSHVARVLPETLLAVEPPAGWDLELELVPSEGESDRWSTAAVTDGEPGSIVDIVHAVGPLRLRARVRGEDAPAATFDAPLSLTGDEEAILVEFVPEDGGWTMQVVLVEDAPGVVLTVRDPARADFEIQNGSDRPIRGIGFPTGAFDGWLVALSPPSRIVPRSRAYCGTGALPFDPLAAGSAAGSGPSAWAMMDERREPSPGEYAWIVDLDADGWGRTIARGSSGTAAHRVTRIAGAVVRFFVPEL